MSGTYDILNEHLLFAITIPLYLPKSPTILEFEATLSWLKVQRNKIHDGWIVTRREKSLLVVIGMQWEQAKWCSPALGRRLHEGTRFRNFWRNKGGVRRSESRQWKENIFHFCFAKVWNYQEEGSWYNCINVTSFFGWENGLSLAMA